MPDPWKIVAGATRRHDNTAPNLSRQFLLSGVGGDLFRGTALRCREREYTGRVDNLGGSFLRFTVECCGDTSQVWCWLAGYNDAVGDIAAIEERFGRMLDGMFERHPVANAARTGER